MSVSTEKAENVRPEAFYSKKKTVALGAVLLLLSLFVFSSCARTREPPRLYPADFDEREAIIAECERFFPSGGWNFVHSIEASFPGDKKTFATGVANISETGPIRSIMMTLEGLVVFDAEYDKELTINRGVPPFDSPEFAKGLVRDILLMFRKPEGEPVAVGKSEAGEYICRFDRDDGFSTDLIARENRELHIKVYLNGHPFRTVRMFETETSPFPGIPDKVELTAHGPRAYELKLRLVRAERTVELGKMKTNLLQQ